MFYKVFCGNEDFEIINPVDKGDYEYLASLDGTSKQKMWKDFEITYEAADVNCKKIYSDFPWYMSSVLILKENVISKMKPFFEANGELLPMHSKDGQKIYAFNCNVIDELDKEKSDVIRLKTGKIILVKKIVFRNEDKITKDIFRLNFKSSPTFVSDNFIKLYNENNFVGLKFIKYTDSGLKNSSSHKL